MIIEKNSYVIATKNLTEVLKHSVGLVKAINGNYAMVYFIGKNLIVRLKFDTLKFIDIAKTGKGFSYKICNICHILKKNKEFDINQTDAKGIKTTRPSCKSCRKDIDGVQLLFEEKQKFNKIKPPFKSIFVCPICEKRSIVGITAKLVLDHNHETGIAREWICDSCNTGLGRFKDNINFISNIFEYLNKHAK